jgi:hypothetical protein
MNGGKTVEAHHPHFHPPWVQRAHIQKYHAYACTNIAAQLHRQHRYRVRFNRDPRHPMVEELIEELPCASADPQDPGPQAARS